MVRKRGADVQMKYNDNGPAGHAAMFGGQAYRATAREKAILKYVWDHLEMIWEGVDGYKPEEITSKKQYFQLVTGFTRGVVQGIEAELKDSAGMLKPEVGKGPAQPPPPGPAWPRAWERALRCSAVLWVFLRNPGCMSGESPRGSVVRPAGQYNTRSEGLRCDPRDCVVISGAARSAAPRRWRWFVVDLRLAGIPENAALFGVPSSGRLVARFGEVYEDYETDDVAGRLGEAASAVPPAGGWPRAAAAARADAGP